MKRPLLDHIEKFNQISEVTEISKEELEDILEISVLDGIKFIIWFDPRLEEHCWKVEALYSEDLENEFVNNYCSLFISQPDMMRIAREYGVANQVKFI